MNRIQHNEIIILFFIAKNKYDFVSDLVGGFIFTQQNLDTMKSRFHCVGQAASEILRRGG